MARLSIKKYGEEPTVKTGGDTTKLIVSKNKIKIPSKEKKESFSFIQERQVTPDSSVYYKANLKLSPEELKNVGKDKGRGNIGGKGRVITEEQYKKDSTMAPGGVLPKYMTPEAKIRPSIVVSKKK